MLSGYFTYFDKELKKPDCTLEILWREYLQKHRSKILALILLTKYQNKIHSFPIGNYPTSSYRFSRNVWNRLSTTRSDWGVPAVRTLIVYAA